MIVIQDKEVRSLGLTPKDFIDSVRHYTKFFSNRSVVIKQICKQLKCKQKDIYNAGKESASNAKYGAPDISCGL